MRKRHNFLCVKAGGEVFKGRFIIIQLLKSPDTKTEIGIITSKRYSCSAVTRNRAKRRIRESFRLIKHRISTPVWIVVIARKMMIEASLETVKHELTDFLIKGGVIEKNSSMPE